MSKLVTTIPAIRSLMEFNKRVLSQGKVSSNKTYDISDLKKKLFFNKIFIDNTSEMFQKYSANEIIDDYIECLNVYINNVSCIIKNIRKCNQSIQISDEDSFERRLVTETHIKDQLITQFYRSADMVDYEFMNDIIYYISILENGSIAISFIDPRRSIYHDILKCDFDGYSLYWKTDRSIRNHITRKYFAEDTIAVKVTSSIKHKREVVKVEYFGNNLSMKRILSIFPKSALVVSNPYIYTDDIKQIIESIMPPAPAVSKPRFKPINFDAIFDKDRLIEFPNDSFDVYLQMLSLASKDKDIKVIYLTLYRIGDNPAIFYILRDAVSNGIKVHVNIELFASGESINMMWLKEMEQAGIKVTTYAAGRLKVHSKLTLIKFTNGRAIAQIGTGNYHTQTTSQYTDLSLITADENICHQVEKVFSIFNGNEDISFSNDLLVSRYNVRSMLIRLIDKQASFWEKGYIAFKCNALDDLEIIDHLNVASHHGCKIDLVIRGVCTWIPDPNTDVSIKSIIWDKLEHSRVYAFGNVNPTIYMGSLDLVTNKLDKRIETLVRIKDPDIAVKVSDYLNKYITNTRESWIQTSSGIYIKEK